ncbi:chemotaxis protein MotB [Aliigemmobacter aestuarii]|uniref:Chemotaxis protein MotB n=1 Tax=Aliigemmobacter aestuarii TaxID=1445661 RepID=A0A4S3MST8_9RHOB|nr:flagellar motor protein MotB [Gemmobacter aestuarii]THD85638.1 chemotaxis protein MotB [Gemmobacter aestuarii]
MAGQSNAAPVIIKRKKVVGGGGHHGGAWKVAYADFVTAMMAFFMLMWLLNATTEKQRKGIADYFNPTIPINRISGGGEGAFGGDSIFTEQQLAQTGTGASNIRPTEANAARGEMRQADQPGVDAQTMQRDTEAIERVIKALTALGGESMTMQQALRHVVTRVTDEGLVIEIFDLEGRPLFVDETASPSHTMALLGDLLSEVLNLAENPVAINAHVRSFPITLIDDPTWSMTADRAMAMRDLLVSAGLPDGRIARVTGHANRRPVTANPMAVRNNRVELVLLRSDR